MLPKVTAFEQVLLQQIHSILIDALCHGLCG